MVKEQFWLLYWIHLLFVCLFLDKPIFLSREFLSRSLENVLNGEGVFSEQERLLEVWKNRFQLWFLQEYRHHYLFNLILENCGEKKIVWYDLAHRLSAQEGLQGITSLLVLAKSRKFDYERDLEGARSFPEWGRKQSKIGELSCLTTCKDEKEIKTKQNGREVIILAEMKDRKRPSAKEGILIC